MFYYKTSILLFNCFLFPHIFLHQGKYIIIFSLPLRTGQAYLRYPCLAASTFSAGCIMPLRLRSPRHHAPVFRFFSHYAQGKHTSFVGILAWLPPHFPHTVAYGMCSVPPHIPYPFRCAPGALLRKRCFATLAAASMFPCPSNLLFLKIFFSVR